MSAHSRPLQMDVGEALPSLEEAERRLAAYRDETLPWLTPEGLAAIAELVGQGVPEINGPMEMRLPDDADD